LIFFKPFYWLKSNVWYLIFKMMVKSMDRTMESYYTVRTTARSPIYSDQTNHLTDTSIAWYQLHSKTISYPTQSSTQWYLWYTNYPTHRTILSRTTEDFYWTPTTSLYPSWTWSSSSIIIELFTIIILSVTKSFHLQSTSTPTTMQ